MSNAELKEGIEPTIIGEIREPDELVSDVLLLHFKSKLSIESIANIFSMDKSAVEKIISKFAEQFSTEYNLMNVVDALAKMKKKNSRRQPECKAQEKTQEAEIADLRRQLTEAQIKAEAYQEMISLAEQIYKIPIRKKFGAK